MLMTKPKKTLETENKPGEGRTATREARRRQLIEATIDSIAIRGFSATTLATVTKGAKLSHGVVNFHFNSKETLYVETLGYLAQEHYDHWHTAMEKAGPNPAKQLAAVIEVDFDHKITSIKKLAVWFAFWGQAKYRPAYLEIHNQYDQQRFAEMKRLCAEIVKHGGYSHIDSAFVARSIEALIDGLWLKMLLYPDAASRAEACDDCLTYLAGVFPEDFPGTSKRFSNSKNEREK